MFCINDTRLYLVMGVVFKYIPTIEETLTIIPPFPPLSLRILTSELLVMSIIAF